MRNCKSEACFIESPIGRIITTDARIKWEDTMTTQTKLGGTNVILLLAVMDANLFSGELTTQTQLPEGCSIRKPQST
jgi:hypothetical protein